jgi:hypothetical protein
LIKYNLGYVVWWLGGLREAVSRAVPVSVDVTVSTDVAESGLPKIIRTI